MVSATPSSSTRWKRAAQASYAVGPFREPKDIPESVIEASGAAAAAAAQISASRFTLTEEVEYPAERDVSSEEPAYRRLCLPLRFEYRRFH